MPLGKAELQTALGNAYLATGNAEAANTAFAAALSAKPDYGRAMLGQAYAKAGARDLPGALALAESAAAKDPKLVEARQLKGDLLLAQGEPDKAIAAYREALGVKADYLPAYAAIVGQLAAQGKLDDAAKELEAMQKVAPKHPQTLYLKATLAYRKKDFPAAKEAIQGVLQVAPDYLPGLLLSGAIDYELKSYAQAEASLTKVLQQAPNAGFARRVLAATYLRERQPAKALDTLKPLLEGGQVDAGLASLAGEVYLQNGNLEEGSRYFEMAAKIDPKSAPARTAVALTHLAKGDTDRAFKELEDTAAADTGTRADLALIAASMRKRDYDRALAAIDALEKKQPDNPAGAEPARRRDAGQARRPGGAQELREGAHHRQGLPARGGQPRAARPRRQEARRREEALRGRAGEGSQERAGAAGSRRTARPGGRVGRRGRGADQQGDRRQSEGVDAAAGADRALSQEPGHEEGDRGRQRRPVRAAGQSGAHPRARPRAAGGRRHRGGADDVQQARTAAANLAAALDPHRRGPDAGQEQQRRDAEPQEGADDQAGSRRRAGRVDASGDRRRPAEGGADGCPRRPAAASEGAGRLHARRRRPRVAEGVEGSDRRLPGGPQGGTRFDRRRRQALHGAGRVRALARTPRSSRRSGPRIIRRTSTSAATWPTSRSPAGTMPARWGSTGRSSRSSPTTRWS